MVKGYLVAIWYDYETFTNYYRNINDIESDIRKNDIRNVLELPIKIHGKSYKEKKENFTDILATFNDMFSFSTITASDSIINPIRKQIDRNVKRYGLINYCYSMGY